MAKKIKHFKLEKFFDFVLTSKDRQTGKGEVITRFLKKHKIPKSRALMVGDSYRYDYLSAKSVGVKALLIETEYNTHYRQGKKLETIKHLKELLVS
jgi:FMN phosphatase YigB (HAD superfamily)